MNKSRVLALQWLVQVIKEGRSVNDLFAQQSLACSPQEKSFAKQLLFGSLRYYHQLATLVNQLLQKPLKNKDQDLLLVMVLGLYQLKHLATPDHAAISESVELTRELSKPWASGLVNGLLRRYQRETAEIENSLEKSVQFQYSHPGWIVKILRQDWPNDFQQILKANNQRAPMVLRVNQRLISRADYLQKLLDSGLDGEAHPIASDAVVLAKAADVTALPGFSDGLVTVQDAAAQMVVDLLDLKPGLKVLDACAAPGGKSTHILQRVPDLALTAIDISARRIDKISQTMQRMGVSGQLICSDVTAVEQWWDGEGFDRILLDVPCSASGVIRRNPDIKVHRKVTDIKPLLATQAKILERCWSLLKPGGILVYATCSVFKDENERQMTRFLSSKRAAEIRLAEPLNEKFSARAGLGYQILPGEAQMDGFYFCALRKTEEARSEESVR